MGITASKRIQSESNTNGISSIDILADKIDERMNHLDSLSDVFSLLDDYDGTDWRSYVNFSNKSYNKILVKRTKNIDLYIICWKAGQKTKIHDHPDRGCLMKILQGQLQENIFSFIEPGKDSSSSTCSSGDKVVLGSGTAKTSLPPRESIALSEDKVESGINGDKLLFLNTNTLGHNEIGYKINKLILHQILSPCDTVSLHIYSPVGYNPKYYKKQGVVH